MLTHLQLRDFVIVDQAELDFAAGLTALTGETGAGKSIIVDALSLIAGGRATGDVVRRGAERAEAAAGFAALPQEAVAWLSEQSIDHDGEVLVRRVIGADGRSRAYLNGQLIPLQSLRDFMDRLIEIHGQQEFQHLVTRDAQRRLLDEHGAAGELAQAVASIHERHRACSRELAALRAAVADIDGRRDMLRFQLTELAAEVTTAADIEALFIERRRIADRGRLAAAAGGALEASYDADGGSAQDLLAKAQSALRAGGGDAELEEAGRLLAEASIIVREAADRLRRYLERLDVDPARQEEIERRAAALEALARKHRRPAHELPQQLAAITQELQALDNSQIGIGELEQRQTALTGEYRLAAARLTTARKAAAAGLGNQVTGLMQSLGMRGGQFAVEVAAGDGEVSLHGSDAIEFLVSANPGQPAKGIAKVASGGELSRISLAIQVAAATKTAVGCMVFDEVDAGIGGAVAEIVGRQLRALGERGQVLCVTHLAQVASQAHSQLRVTKLTDGKATRTTIKALNAAERADEIARMLGGIDITEQARAHAREMLSRASSEGTAKTKRSRG